MGMMGEIANEAALAPVLKAIASELNRLSDPDDSYCGSVLKRLGRLTLEQLDWPTGNYRHYHDLFKET